MLLQPGVPISGWLGQAGELANFDGVFGGTEEPACDSGLCQHEVGLTVVVVVRESAQGGDLHAAGTGAAFEGFGVGYACRKEYCLPRPVGTGFLFVFIEAAYASGLMLHMQQWSWVLLASLC